MKIVTKRLFFLVLLEVIGHAAIGFEIELKGGTGDGISTLEGYGSVFIRYNDELCGVSSTGWDHNVRSVLCRSLGFKFGSAPLSTNYNYFETYTLQFQFKCTGDESSLQECTYSIETVTYSGAATESVECYDILIDGRHPSVDQTGIVQYRFKGEVYTQCSEDWGTAEQSLVCYQIGYPDSSSVIYKADGQLTHRTAMAKWQCNYYNLEDSLELWNDCNYSLPTYASNYGYLISYSFFGASCGDENSYESPGFSDVAYVECSVCRHGKFGYNCNRVCGMCKNAELCDQKTGACNSGCQPFYVHNQTDCTAYVAAVDMKLSRPEVMSVSDSQVVLRLWFSNIVDEQLYPYYRFVVEYKKENDATYARLQDNFALVPSTTYTNMTLSGVLSGDAVYDVRVVLYRNVGEDEGRCWGTESDSISVQPNSEKAESKYRAAFIAMLVLFLLALVAVVVLVVLQCRNRSHAQPAVARHVANNYEMRDDNFKSPGTDDKLKTPGDAPDPPTVSIPKQSSKVVYMNNIPGSGLDQTGSTNEGFYQGLDHGYLSPVASGQKPRVSAKPSPAEDSEEAAGNDELYIDMEPETDNRNSQRPLPAVPGVNLDQIDYE